MNHKNPIGEPPKLPKFSKGVTVREKDGTQLMKVHEYPFSFDKTYSKVICEWFIENVRHSGVFNVDDLIFISDGVQDV